MSDVDLLREAAAKMRERAENASDGRWTTGTDGLVWAPRLGDPVSGSSDERDAEHIASWDPTVALAVARWLDDAADCHVQDENTGVAWTDCTTAERAVEVARAYLRSGS